MKYLVKVFSVALAMMAMTSSIACAQEPVREKTVLPESFVNTRNNEIGNSQYLDAFWKKVDSSTDTIRVMQIGDSHIAGRILPNTIGNRLKEYFGRVKFTSLCKNGVQINWFLSPERYEQIQEFNPDLLIVSVGTNEAHSNFYPEKYQRLMGNLVHIVDSVCPGTTVMFTTTPGSHLRNYASRTVTVGKGRKAKTKTVRSLVSITPNAVNDSVTNCQINFCNIDKHAYWDLYNISGGITEACHNWKSSKLMRDDALHFGKEGYELQGNLFSDALIETYENYKKKK